jgi:type I restriction enzyme, S subunit
MPEVAAPPGWRWVALSEVARMESGHTPSRRHPEYWSGSIPWISIGDARDAHGGTIVDTEEHTNALGIANSSARLLPVNTVCLSRTASVGYVVVTGAPMATSQDFVNFVCSESLRPRFLQYLFLAEGEDLLRFASGSVHQTIYFPEAKAFYVCIPPLTEQERIVGILDEAFDGIASAKTNAKRNLRNASAIFESHLQSVFTRRGPEWEERSVSEIATHSLGKMLDKAKNRGTPRPYLRNINVRWFGVDLSDLLEMPFLPTEAEKYTAVRGDVLICEGGYPGRAAIWNEDYPIYFQKALHRVRFQQPDLNKWFVYFLYSQDASGQLKRHFSGTGIQHFTGQGLARFKMPVPPLPVMRRAVAIFDALSEEVDRLACIYERKLDALEALKQSLLQQAFTGQQ